MTKTLTENRWFYTENGIKDASWNIVFKSEALAPVPSYEKWKHLQKLFVESLNTDVKLKEAYEQLEDYSIKTNRLEKQLAIATKALKEIEHPSFGNIYNVRTDEIDYSLLEDVATKALKEIEEVK